MSTPAVDPGPPATTTDAAGAGAGAGPSGRTGPVDAAGASAAGTTIAGGLLARVLGRPARRRARPLVWFAVGWLALVALAAIAADWLPLDGYDRPAADPNLRPGISSDQLLGTDTQGRSQLSRVIYGARVSLAVGVGSVAISFVVGGLVGLTAGYFRGRTERAVGVLADSLLAYPPLVLLLAMTASLGTSLRSLVVALALLTTPAFVRIARASTLGFAQREFVMAARALGARHQRLMFREILPNVLMPMLSYAFLVVAVVVVAEGSLSFLGLGIPPPSPSWGGMIAAGKQRLGTDPHLVFVPAVVMFTTVFALNVIGDWARTRFDVRESALG